MRELSKRVADLEAAFADLKHVVDTLSCLVDSANGAPKVIPLSDAERDATAKVFAKNVIEDSNAASSEKKKGDGHAG